MFTKRTIKYVVVVLLLFMCVGLNAQKIMHRKSYEVNINGNDGYTKAVVLCKNSKFKPNESYTYYWYALNKIIATKGGFDGVLLNGSYVSFYSNDNLRERGVFKKGLKSGKWITWYNNGIIKETCIWRNGMLNGVRRTFDSDGKVLTEEYYRNDVLNGKVTTYKAGKILTIKFYKNGTEYFKKPKPEKEQNGPKDEQPKVSLLDKIKNLFHSNKDKNTDKKSNE